MTHTLVLSRRSGDNQKLTVESGGVLPGVPAPTGAVKTLARRFVEQALTRGGGAVEFGDAVARYASFDRGTR